MTPGGHSLPGSLSNNPGTLLDGMLAAAAPDADTAGLAAQNAVAPTVGADNAALLLPLAEELRIRELAVTGSARPLLPAVTSSPMLGVRTSPG